MGPWSATPAYKVDGANLRQGGNTAILAADGRILATAWTGNEHPTTAEELAAMVAAPELLEACEVALDRLDGDCDATWREAVAVLRAAVAKAKGHP
jgi:hypothetical protein